MSYKRYEWTAFTESDLLQNGDSNLNKGDSFTMPGSATVTMATWDNDKTLSGDNWRNENANDRSGQKAEIDGVREGSQLYAESYHVLQGSNGKTYYLIEIEVEGYNAPGVGSDFFTFYGAVPPEGVELTLTQTCNVTGCWVDYRCIGAGDTAPPNTPPEFTNLPENGILCIDENTKLVIDINGSDADGDALTYTITGGRDASFFEIDAATGELSFIAAPDFENPLSGGNNNTYDVTITVDDGKGGTTTKALWVKVKDVDETDPECIVIEAEDMSEHGFRTVHGKNASGGELVKLNCAEGSGQLYTTFNGTSGEYDLTIRAQDESDGQSTLTVQINGVSVGVITLDNDNNGGGSDNGHFSNFTLENVQINAGDEVRIIAQGNHGEYVRIDNIELCKDGEACPDGFSLQDFSGAAAGAVVASQFDGFTVTAQRDGDAASSENDAMIFDSANPTGGDRDLGFANLGNIIIISEDNDSSDPDDNAGGGSITFDFDNPSDLHDIKLLDIEEAGGTIDLFDENGALIKSVAIPAAGNNSIQTILLDAQEVGSMVITLVGSGAVDDLCFKPGEAPLPGSLSGTYFCDENRDGLDNDNSFVAGVTVELLDAAGNGTGITTLTDANGNYSFGNLAAGTYGVKFTDTVSGKALVDANVGGDDAIDSDATDLGNGMSEITGITVVAGQDTPDNDAGVEALPGALSGTYFCDDDFDGIDDGAANGDPDVAGKLVTLLNADGTAAVDIDGNAVAAVRTNAEGNYRFDNLAAGDYKVMFEADPVKEFIAPNVGNDDSVDSDVDPATGMTGVVSVVAGAETTDVDAGIKDPGTASLGDLLFIDTNGNGQQDFGEMGVADVEVTLINTNGGPNQTTTTNAQGNYLFNNLTAGTYQVLFDAVEGFAFTTTDQGNDATDSDADATGLTGTYDLAIGEQNLTVDAGIVALNKAPTPVDDAGMGCSDTDIAVNVLANDTDPENDALTVTAVNGVAIGDGDTITIDGVDITLNGGELTFNGEGQFAGLDIGESATVAYTYTVSDGEDTAEAEAAITFCGTANTIDSLFASLPTAGTYQVRDDNLEPPIGTEAYDIRISGTGDARFDGMIFDKAYCLSLLDPASTAEDFADAPLLSGDILDGKDGSVFSANQVSFANGENAADNLDLINWLIAQDFEGANTNAVDGQFTGWEVQRAIWELTDQFDTDYLSAIDPAYGDNADVDFLVNAAINPANEGFMAGPGGIATLIIDPNPATAANSQPFIAAFNFDDFDCIC